MSDLRFEFPYPSRRVPVLARNVVATSQPLAAQAGLKMLWQGGNAVDAAVATAIALTVVEPTGNGIGGDAFALIWDGQALHGLNATGRSPRQFSNVAHRRAERHGTVRGWPSVTVPGAVSSWVALSQKFGKLPFESLFEPAIRYARDGFLVTPTIAAKWSRAVPLFRGSPGFADAFLRRGRAPGPGETFAFEDQAQTLETIASSLGEEFYRGSLARKVAAYAASAGASLTFSDLAEHESTWVDTLYRSFRGYDVHELPPNSQGVAVLIALGILERRECDVKDAADTLHLQIEAMKLAFKDTYRFVADPETMDSSPESLLDDNHLNALAGRIDMRRAQDYEHVVPHGDGTVYLASGDASGMMVSFIQSNYQGFGSGIVVPGTGISLQNRAAAFSFVADHPNAAGPGKRPFHTLIPAFVMKGEHPVMALGVMGGSMQPQGHVQMMTRIIGHGQNPQAASDAPRWRVRRGLEVDVETGFDQSLLDDLQVRGHTFKTECPSRDFGGAQAVYRLEGGYLAASDHRKDGQAVGY